MSENIPTLEEMLKSGVHFGHRVSRWHPKMEQYIFSQRDGVHVIDLEKTSTKLAEALDFLKKIVTDNGTVLFLGTKPQSKEIVREAAEACKMPYIVERWLGGTFTNIKTILSLLKKYNKEKADKESGEWEKKYNKKEQLERERALAKMAVNLEGIADLKALPEVVFVVDCQQEKTAIREARKSNVPIVALCDTNVNPDLIDYPIPANDDAVKSIKLMVGAVADALGVVEKKVDAPMEKEKPKKEVSKNK